mgnify:CR=1 FL=1
MKISQNGLDIIHESESFSSVPYLCPSKIPTIGWGNTYYEDGTKVTLNDKPISQKKGDELFSFILSEFETQILNLVKVPLNQNQFDALVSFAYNVGIGNFKQSTLLKKLNNSDFIGASLEFKKWNKSNSKVLKGLVRRRLKEKELFLK